MIFWNTIPYFPGYFGVERRLTAFRLCRTNAVFTCTKVKNVLVILVSELPDLENDIQTFGDNITALPAAMLLT